MRRLLLLFALVVALTAVGTAMAVVGGSADNGAHPYVGAALQQQVHGGVTGTELCSGFLLSATKFVTAAHCFPDESTVHVTFDENARTSSTFYSGTVHVMPGFCLPCGPGAPNADANDVAVVVLSGAGAPQSRYAQLAALGSDDSLRTNQPIDVVGYGVSGIQAGTVTAFGTRQRATTKLNKVGDEFLKLLADPGACLGDSGGPDLLAGTDVVVAENSYSPANPNCNGVAYAERLDTVAAQAFIASWS
jgi:secreted trypsin-like serine protease